MYLIENLRHKLIVSCQAEDGFPLNTPDHLTALAQTAVIGGASAIRASEPANIHAMKQALDVPIIGIYKKDYPGFAVRITPTILEIEAIVEAGSDIVALDATNRPRPDGLDFAQLMQIIRERFDVPVMADISTLDEGIQAASLGVDIVATTLSGYTQDSHTPPGPDIQLIRDLATVIDVPIIAEGRIGTPEDVRAALEVGAHAVVVGSMITRPHLITKHFATGLMSTQKPSTTLAIDIGGTKIAGGVVDNNGQILEYEKIETNAQQGQQHILTNILELIQTIKDCMNSIPPTAIGISTGGQINASGEIIGSTGMLPGWLGLPLKDEVAKRFELPTFVINDGHAAALAEYHFGAGRERPSMLCVVVGTGLGGGLVINGRLQHGANGLAGSIGQMKVSFDGKAYMPLEAVVSGPGLAEQYNKLNPTNKANSGAEVAQRATTGDKDAQQAIIEMGEWLGLGLSHALHTYDADCVVIGGSVAQIGDLFLDAVRRSLLEHGHSSVAHTPILSAKFGPKAGLVGAAVWAHQQTADK